MNELKEITAIEIQVKNRNRRSIYLNGEFAFGIHQDVLLEQSIGIGDSLSESQINDILLAEQIKQAKARALRLLSVRARSELEIRKRLKDAKVDETAIEQAINDLTRIGLLDDKEFAFSFARNRIVTKSCGEILLKQELKNKGVSEEIIDLAIVEAYKEKSQTELANNLAQKKKRQYQNIDEIKARKRTTDFLLRRGFSWDIVSSIIEGWQDLE